MNFKELPKKLFEVCDFRKNEQGETMLYSYESKLENRDVIIVCSLTDFNIPHDFKVVNKAIEATNRLCNDTLKIEVDENTYHAKSSKGSYKVGLVNSIGFQPPKVEYLKTVNTHLNLLLKATEYVGIKNNRPILRGVQVDFNGNIIATDGYRIYINKVADFNNQGITIPTSFIKVVKDNFADTDEIELSISNKFVKASQGNISIIGNLYEGNYPNLEKILNNATQIGLKDINKGELIEALDYLKYIVNDSKDKVNYLIFKDNLLTIKAQSTFETSYDLGLEDSQICMQASYLLEALKVFDEDTLKCSCNSGDVKSLMSLCNNANEYVILMCIRID